MTGQGNNTYLLIGESGDAALIDAGIGEPQHLGELQSALTHRGAQLRSVLVTHAHPDHASGASAIARAHPSTVFLKYPWPGEDEKFPVEWRPLADGQTTAAGDDRLEVIHTPGHSPDHVVFWHEPTRTLFAGDLVIPGASVSINTSRGGNLARYLESLSRLILLEPAHLFPAHGKAVANPGVALKKHLEHRLVRERQILVALSAGRDTVESIADSIYDGVSPALVPAARNNVRAHLDKLRAESRAVEIDGRWTLQRTRP